MTALEKNIAAEHFGDGKNNFPRFFTTLRWILGEAAEEYLRDISYSG